MQDVILNSGGMDSFLMAWRVPNALHVFVDIGQTYHAKELVSARRIASFFDATLYCVDGAKIAGFEHPSGIIPYRNAELILSAAQFGNRIHLGVVADEINSDKSPEFFDAMVRVLNISHKSQYWSENDKLHEIALPLRDHSKAEWIQLFLSHVSRGLEPLLETVSCYSGVDHHCGACASCFKRWIALTVATGKPNVQYFEKAPWDWFKADKGDVWREVVTRYPNRRRHETILALTIAGQW